MGFCFYMSTAQCWHSGQAYQTAVAHMVWVTCDGSGGKAAGANPGLEYSLWFDLNG